jgi:hypothetical protein
MYARPFIREDDSVTPGGGKVQPTPQQYPSTYHDKLACFEGDPVYCNTCKTWGVTKCVPPYRPYIDPNGRQVSLDGDLCICKCPTPPRLKASFDNIRMLFEEDEFSSMAGVEDWLEYEGHKHFAYDQHFLILNEETKRPDSHRKYRITYSRGVIEGTTDVNGLTSVVKSNEKEKIKLELF